MNPLHQIARLALRKTLRPALRQALRQALIVSALGGVLPAATALADNGAVDRSREIMLPADAPVGTQLQELEKRWGDFYLKYNDPAEVTRLNRAADRLFPLLGADGRFSDLRYANVISKRDGGPGWGDHLLRLVDLFTAWRTPGTKVFGDAAFAKRCAKGLDAYCAQPYDRNDVWGFGHPYADLLESNRIGRICLFARTDPKAIPQAQIERWAGRIIKSIFQPSDDPATQFTRNRPGLEGGANLLWSARGELAAYLVQSDEALRLRAVDRYMKYIWRSMTITSPKGPDGGCERLTVDGMLGEHHVPAMGSYGEWYVSDIVNFRDALQGLPRWQMPGEINKVFVDLLLDSVAFCYQGAIDPHLCDHGAWLNGRAPHNATLRRWMTAFLGCGYRTDELKRVLAWEPGVSDWPNKDRSVRQYYTIDYMTKHYPRWMASVRAVSNRTYGMETFAPYHAPMRNDDLNIFVPLGTCFLRRDTREFQDLATGSAFAALDFARLPGLTTKHVDDATIRSCWNSQDGHPSRYVWGNTPFSVGVATEQTGLMGWWQSRYVLVDKDKPQITKRTDISVDGRRATFFLEDAIVQLGAGFDIRDKDRPTFTSLEQRQSADAPIVYGIGADVRTLKAGGAARDAGITWAWYDGVGYVAPTDGTKVIEDKLQSGPPAKRIFSFYADHGRAQDDLSFAYAIIPGITADEMPAYVAHEPWRVIANTPAVQAIAVPAKGWTGAVFHQAGAISVDGQTLAVDRPAGVIVIREPGKCRVYASDPLGNAGRLTVTIGDATARVELPDTPHRGATATATLVQSNGVWTQQP